MNQGRRTKLVRVDELLRRRYGEPKRRRRRALDALIGTILSQNTNDVNSARAYESMRTAFPTWKAVMNAAPDELEAALRPGGLARTKSRRIQAILRAIAKRGALDLEYLRKVPDAEAEAELLWFKGVGLKTARCVLLFALGRDVFPVDTHIERVLKRLGVVPAEMNAEQVHRSVPDLLPQGRCLALHVNLIAHGRDTCHPRNPECPQCILRPLCAYRRAAPASCP